MTRHCPTCGTATTNPTIGGVVLVDGGRVTFDIPERPIEKARARVVEAAKAWADEHGDSEFGRVSAALIAAVAELERLEAEGKS